MSTVSIERVRHLNQTDKIQQRAFSLLQRSGERPGLHREDWLPAEHGVLGTSLAELVEGHRK